MAWGRIFKGSSLPSSRKAVLTVTDTTTNIMATNIMSNHQHLVSQVALLRQQSWLSPAFPTGSYSYSHAIEWSVEAGYIHDRESLVDWLEADLRYGSGRK